MGIVIDDTHLLVNRFSNVCTRCRHLKEYDPLGSDRTCIAFPNGIPVEIWSGLNDHTKPFEGDNGIQFEPIPQGKS